MQDVAWGSGRQGESSEATRLLLLPHTCSMRMTSASMGVPAAASLIEPRKALSCADMRDTSAATRDSCKRHATGSCRNSSH